MKFYVASRGFHDFFQRIGELENFVLTNSFKYCLFKKAMLMHKKSYYLEGYF